MNRYHVPAWVLKAIAFSAPLSLFGLSFLDSTVLPLPSLNDLLLIDLCIRSPLRMPYYAALATIGSTAPFVGLFGTVTGIIHAFQGIEQSHATGLSAVAGGIAEALVTTAMGLVVAVPAVWAYNYFTNRVEAFDVEMDNSSMELINYFILRRGAKK